uniref:Uncharacterized protein n=1 Tax=Setaria italica TaxID=4555 RepID=K3YWU5_SETIT
MELVAPSSRRSPTSHEPWRPRRAGPWRPWRPRGRRLSLFGRVQGCAAAPADSGRYRAEAPAVLAPSRPKQQAPWRSLIDACSHNGTSIWLRRISIWLCRTSIQRAQCAMEGSWVAV